MVTLNRENGNTIFSPYPQIKLKHSFRCSHYMHYSKKLKDSMGNTVLHSLKNAPTKVSKKYKCHNCRFLKIKEVIARNESRPPYTECNKV